LHTRNLIEFLTQQGGDDLITASQFSVGIDPYKLNFPKNNGEYEINKYLSHLTWERITGDSPKWNVNGIYEEIIEKLKDFFSRLPNDSFPTKPREKDKEVFVELLK